MSTTRASVCARKVAHASEAAALAVAAAGAVPLRVYRCDRCGRFHLTSRTKGKRVPRPGGPMEVGGLALARAATPRVDCDNSEG